MILRQNSCVPLFTVILRQHNCVPLFTVILRQHSYVPLFTAILRQQNCVPVFTAILRFRQYNCVPLFTAPSIVWYLPGEAQEHHSRWEGQGWLAGWAVGYLSSSQGCQEGSAEDQGWCCSHCVLSVWTFPWTSVSVFHLWKLGTTGEGSFFPSFFSLFQFKLFQLFACYITGAFFKWVYSGNLGCFIFYCAIKKVLF